MRHLVPVGLGLCLASLGVALWIHPERLTPAALAANIHRENANQANRAVAVTNCQDRDGDGYGLGCSLGNDCNDRDPQVHPGQRETCNFRDDDCNAEVDDSLACASLPESLGHVTVPASEFAMGSPVGEGANDERPRHHVWLSGFELDRFEVTNRRYQACVKTGQCEAPQLRSSHLRSNYFDDDRYLDYPVVFVSKRQAETFCRFDGGRLPTEAEWEKSARGANPSLARFPWGDRDPDCSLANFGGTENCVGDTDRVGRRPLGQSPYGAMDMAGNVWEWVADWYGAEYYQGSPAKDPKGPQQGTLGIARGGCWESGADSLRVSCRKPLVPNTWAYNVGFRCAYGKEH